MLPMDIPRNPKPSVLFVCTANICRSPMAEILFRTRLQQSMENWRDWVIGSGGTWAEDGHSASDFAVKTMAARGLDLSGHASRSVSKEMMDEYNLILTMENEHRDALTGEYPYFEKRIFMLSEMTGIRADVRDPYGGDMEEYQYAADILDGLIRDGFSRIVFLAR